MCLYFDKNQQIFLNNNMMNSLKKQTYKKQNQQENLILSKKIKNLNFVFIIKIKSWKIERILFEQMKSLLFYFIIAVNIKFVSSKKFWLKVIFMRNEKNILSLYFKTFFYIIKKNLIISENLKLLLKKKLKKNNRI